MQRKQIAIITGATSGFGKIFTEVLDDQFSKLDELWLIGRRSDVLIDMSNELHHKTKLIPFDLKRSENLQRMKGILKKEKPAVKFLVNAAGFGLTGYMEEQQPEELAEMIDVNCRALTYLSRACLPYMARNSRVINFASVAAFMPQPRFAVYAATKAYVLSFTRALNCELREKGVYATAVCPGPARTKFFERAEKYEQAGSYKELFMVEPEVVVEQALHDSIMKREVSVYGIPMKIMHVLTKVLPRKWIFSFLA